MWQIKHVSCRYFVSTVNRHPTAHFWTGAPYLNVCSVYNVLNAFLLTYIYLNIFSNITVFN